MKKVQVCRQSGRPVKLKNLDAFEEEWKNRFDVAYEKHGKDMLSLQTELAEIETELSHKYDTVENWDFLKTKKAWKATLEEYGNILVSTNINTGEILYVIVDQQL